jgi:hypothetical protein
LVRVKLIQEAVIASSDRFADRAVHPQADSMAVHAGEPPRRMPRVALVAARMRHYQ